MPRAVTLAVAVLYLCALALLPWTWWPPFPWLHKHAQWSDAVFALAATLWLWEARPWRRLRLAHAAVAAYVGWAVVSFAWTGAGGTKLLGIAELAALAIVTGDLAARPGMMRWIARIVLASGLLVAIAALVGVTLFHAGVATRLVGSYGSELIAGPYARAEAGFYHPNLLASWCIFAAAVVAHPDAELPGGWRRAAQAAITLACVLAISRGLFGLIASWAIRRRRGWLALACATLIIAGNIRTLSIDPTHPLAAHLRPGSRAQTISSTLHTAVEHPLVGSGPGTQPGFLGAVPHDAHLTPLNIAATMGLPALCAFAAILILIWRGRRRPTDLATWGGLAGLGVDALASDIEDFRHVWIMLGIALAQRRNDA